VDPKTQQNISPGPVTILNAAYIVYLDRLAELMNRIDGQDIDSITDRARWVEKLEMWTLKALEDHELVAMGKERVIWDAFIN